MNSKFATDLRNVAIAEDASPDITVLAAAMLACAGAGAKARRAAN